MTNCSNHSFFLSFFHSAFFCLFVCLFVSLFVCSFLASTTSFFLSFLPSLSPSFSLSFVPYLLTYLLTYFSPSLTSFLPFFLQSCLQSCLPSSLFQLLRRITSMFLLHSLSLRVLHESSLTFPPPLSLYLSPLSLHSISLVQPPLIHLSIFISFFLSVYILFLKRSHSLTQLLAESLPHSLSLSIVP